MITTSHGEQRSGLTASAVSSPSRDPALLLVCIDNRLPGREAIEGSRRFVANVLGERRQDLALHFARPSTDAFAGIALRDDQELPVLDDAVAYFICDVHERFPGGDHSFFTGLVRECGAKPGRRPLLDRRSGFGSIRDDLADELDEAALSYAGSAGSLSGAPFGLRPPR